MVENCPFRAVRASCAAVRVKPWLSVKNLWNVLYSDVGGLLVNNTGQILDLRVEGWICLLSTIFCHFLFSPKTGGCRISPTPRRALSRIRHLGPHLRTQRRYRSSAALHAPVREPRLHGVRFSLVPARGKAGPTDGRPVGPSAEAGSVLRGWGKPVYGLAGVRQCVWLREGKAEGCLISNMVNFVILLCDYASSER